MNLLDLLLISPLVASISNESYSIQLCPGFCSNSTSLPSFIRQRGLPLIDNEIINNDLISPIHRPSILFHGMHSSDSHIGSMLPTMKSMAAGLDVEVHLLETHFRPNRYNLPSEINHTFISIDEIKYFDEEVFAPMWTASKGADYFAFAWVPGERALRQLATDYSDQFRSILDKRWDLMVIDDLFTVTGYSLAMRNRAKHDRPYILMSTTLPTIHWQSMMALGNNGLYRGSLYAPWDFTISRFSHRLEAIYQALLNGLGMKMINEWLLTMAPSLLGITDYSISRLVSEATYYYLDDVNYFSYPSPVGHDVVHVGLSCPPQGDRLPDEYEDFVASNHSKGVIYIAFGSNVPWKFAPAHHMRVFVQGLNHFRDHRVIFSFNGRLEQLEGLRDHVMVTKWAPQKEILSDQRTKLYITHGGLKSMKESVCTETPVLFMPLFAEQSHNAHLAYKEGFGEILFKKSLTTDDFISKVHRLLTIPSYKEKARRFKQFMLDRPLSAEATVSYHTRRALIKHSELNRFKRVGQFLPYSSHFYLHHMGAILALIFLLSR